jgi:hypothetical protein
MIPQSKLSFSMVKPQQLLQVRVTNSVVSNGSDSACSILRLWWLWVVVVVAVFADLFVAF